ncbi:4-alpha-glucanotransferase [Pseudoalteromonas sp. SR43-3]|uniref:4-alpha-glucanotransferase n=1 Tax=Pseudoalteromonas sp. SR43-3 TaxID=2760943 RepID=UPI0015FEDCF6|nr:4-alpha-glucanotransferase [Pseudoalteromonas sp. SR43-3]MBB1276456.1 4-alpha-glucanotransferase [Pseudoalteromonas sp. SR43-3]
MDALSQLFYLHGIGFEFTKYTGEQVFFSEETRKRALQCCGVDTNNEAGIAQLTYDLDASLWLDLVPSVSLVEQTACLFKLRIDERQQYLAANIDVPSLGMHLAFDNLYNLAVTGEYYLHGVRYIELALPIGNMPIGYHDANVQVGEQHAITQIWCVPEQVYQVGDTKRTGLSIQLYTLKNRANFGIGDFDDLLALTKLCSSQNMDYILLNPLHLLFADMPERASPYSPNSRALLNPLYISIVLSEDAINNENLDAIMQQDDVAALIKSNDQFIDYENVSRIKYTLFEALYNQFELTASDERRQAFTDFCNAHSTTLNTLESDNLTFAYYLQWQAHMQLALCQKSCAERGMAIGLINDLAVGCAGDGAEFKNQQSLFSQGASVGAPPDPWAEAGQNWGLPALNPQSLSNNHYQFYRSLIRANMQNVGGLRIDHVMAIRRLWWCFESNGEQDGCYVYYPFEHLLAILKIESHINQSIVIGEDLGIVPPEVREALASSGIFSNSLFYFEKQHSGEFLSVDELATHCLLMIANHDVPPFTGWWQHDDLDIKQQYKLITCNEYEQLKQQRIEEQQRLLRFINHHGNTTELLLHSEAVTVYSALALCLAGSQSRLFAIQIDDLDEQKYPVNIPGTDKEYPNWRRVLTHTSEEIFTKNASLLAAIDSIRKG